MTSSIFALLIAICANAAANMFLKAAMTHIQGRGTQPLLNAALSTPALWLGLGLAAVLLLSYLYALQRIPLRLAYAAVTVGSLCVISIASIFVFGALPSWRTALGIILAGGAVYLLS